MREPLDYPWDVATTPFVVRAEGVRLGDETPPAHDALTIVASGSNASPSRLWEKLHDDLGARSVTGEPCLVTDLTPVYSAHFTAYGALPATLERDRGACARLVCLHVPPEVLPVLHRSEALGRNYGFYRLGDTVVVSTAGVAVPAPHAYLSLRGVLCVDGSPRRLTAFGSEGSAFKAASESGIMFEAGRVIAPELSLPRLVERLVEDAAFRAASSEHLQSHYGRPLDDRRLQRIA